MATARSTSRSCASGGVISAGRYQNKLDSVSIYAEDANVPDESQLNRMLVMQLHGSSGQSSIGRHYRANVSNRLAVDTYNTFDFCAVKMTEPTNVRLCPIDLYGSKESYWEGFANAPGVDYRLATTRRLDAMLNWVFAGGVANLRTDTTVLIGGSMGGTGTLVFGVRRPSRFAAIYPDRPRWRYSYTSGYVYIPRYSIASGEVAVASAPLLATDDGGYSVADYKNIISYISNTGNKIPWIGWNVGRNDGTMPFADHIAAVAAMIAAKRGFAFAWNNGDHTSGSIPTEITQSYPYGTFKVGTGYPLFTNHSGDQNPSVDTVGGINIGLSFRNVTESVGAWSCEVTSILGARTVDVEPISDVFKTTVTPQTITIPAANTWVSASFSG